VVREAESLITAAIEAQEQGRLRDSAALFERALRIDPNDTEALCRYAMLALQAGRPDVALPVAQRAASADGASPVVQNLLGVVLRQNGRLADAIERLQSAVILDPEFRDARINLGNALLDAGEPQQALPHYEKALALDPASAATHNNLGNLYRELRRPTEAIESYRQALAIDPQHARAHANLGNLLKDLGDTDGAIAAFRQSLRLAPDRPDVWSNLLLTQNCSDHLSTSTIDAEHRAFGERFAPLLPPMPPAAATVDHARLRVGYVSADFRNHAVATFFEPLLRSHDRSRFEVFCYYNYPRGDAVTERIRTAAEHFVPVSGMTDAQLSGRIRRDGIDVLIDLNGHTADNRLPLFFLRPAPVQATWLGYLGKTGVPTIDWRITDAYVDPEEGTLAGGSEKPWRLPHTQWCYQPYAGAPEVGPLPFVRNGHVTFACLNNPGKVSPATLAMWREILRQLPGSRMILLTSPDAGRMSQLLAGFQQDGVDAGRVELIERVPLRDYLAIYSRADIALDTYPYTGGTTTCDALWMGVPVVTCATRRAFGRSGASILANVGLVDLVTQTPEQYVDVARDLARDTDRVASLRGELRQRLLASPLTDAPRFARAFEEALEAMWCRRTP
jgi:predicted O-linked N-acetylglucosamine transferase (SPINDLY family)